MDKGKPPVSEERLDWLQSLLLEKLQAKGGKLSLGIKKAMQKYDLDNSGELEITEFRKAMKEILHGVGEAEIDALAMRYDEDHSGAITINEFTDALLAFERGEERMSAPTDALGAALPPPPAGMDKARQFLQSHEKEDVGVALRAQMNRTRRRRRAPSDIVTMSSFPGDYDDEGQAALGALGRTYEARLETFMAKLRGRVADMAEEKRAHVDASKRLPLRRQEMIRMLSQRLVEKVFEKQAGEGAGANKLTPEQFRRALAHFRTPGQPLLSQPDTEQLWRECNRGDPKEFLRKFFHEHPQLDEKHRLRNMQREHAGGDGKGKKPAKAGINGMGNGDALKLNYRCARARDRRPRRARRRVRDEQERERYI